MGLCWWVLVCGAVLEVVGTTMAPGASASSSPMVVSPGVSPGMGTKVSAPVLAAAATVPGGTPDHTHPEEPTMNFTLRLLDEDPSALKKLVVVRPGSTIHLEARVDFGPGISLKIYVEQCYGTSTEQLGHSKRIFLAVNSHGCLHGQNLGSQHQRGGTVLLLSIPTPVLEEELQEEEEVYIHCLLSARGHRARSCIYSQTTASWHNTMDPSRSTLCHCCATVCPSGDTLLTELPGFLGEGTLHWEKVGPLLVQKEKVPWDEAPCHTAKRFLLAGVALVGSVLVAATLLGVTWATWHLCRGQRGHRRWQRHQSPFHAELQSVVRALVPREQEVAPERGLA